MMKCGCPPQDDISSFLKSSGWANDLSVKVIEALKLLLNVEHLRYRNRLEQVNTICVYQASLSLMSPLA